MKSAQSIIRTPILIALASTSMFANSATGNPDRSDPGGMGESDGGGRDRGYTTFVIDVAIDGRTFAPVGVQNVAPEGEEANYLPVRGTTFIIDGLILPGDTLPQGSGVVVDDYSDASIGTWLCRGHFIHSFMAILTEGASPHVASTQQFFFGENGIVKDDELITEGNEGGTTTNRVVTGGTGEFRGMSGEVTQQPLGVNDTGFGNYRFTFKIKKKG